MENTNNESVFYKIQSQYLSDKKKYKRPELPLPFRPLQVSPPALTSLPPRQPAKDFCLLCFIFYFLLIFLEDIMIIKRVLQTPWWALAGLWCSQVQPSFLLWQHRCKNICQCLHFQTIFAFAGIWSLFFLGLGKGKNRMQASRVHIADQ